MTTAEEEFDAMVVASLNAFDETRKYSASASPDGLSTERKMGQWRIVHDCEAPRTSMTSGYPDPHGRIVWRDHPSRSYLFCRGCGQAFSYAAYGERDGAREVASLSDEAWARFEADNPEMTA